MSGAIADPEAIGAVVVIFAVARGPEQRECLVDGAIAVVVQCVADLFHRRCIVVAQDSPAVADEGAVGAGVCVRPITRCAEHLEALVDGAITVFVATAADLHHRLCRITNHLPCAITGGRPSA